MQTFIGISLMIVGLVMIYYFFKTVIKNGLFRGIVIWSIYIIAFLCAGMVGLLMAILSVLIITAFTLPVLYFFGIIKI